MLIFKSIYRLSCLILLILTIELFQAEQIVLFRKSIYFKRVLIILYENIQYKVSLMWNFLKMIKLIRYHKRHFIKGFLFGKIPSKCISYNRSFHLNTLNCLISFRSLIINSCFYYCTNV